VRFVKQNKEIAMQFEKSFLDYYRAVSAKLGKKAEEGRVHVYYRPAKPEDAWWLGEDAGNYHILVKLIEIDENDFELELRLENEVVIIPGDMFKKYTIYPRDFKGVYITRGTCLWCGRIFTTPEETEESEWHPHLCSACWAPICKCKGLHSIKAGLVRPRGVRWVDWGLLR
jgi:hypothetical protein